ncbi:MAG: precorrin-2 C(20)-methyltransferase [Pseudomonadota bacterium]
MGRIVCAGLGPGDPQLMSVKSDRAIREARHLAYFRKAGRPGQARRIVNGMLRDDVVEYAMEYPVTTEIPVQDGEYNRQLAEFYDYWAAKLQTLAAEEDIVVLCEGDPFLYGSFMHLHERLQGRAEVEVIPGIPSMAGCWNILDTPFTWGDDILTVLMGTMPEDDMVPYMQSADALVVMKIGRNLPAVRRALTKAGKLDEAWLVVRGTMPDEQTARLSEYPKDTCPYFATVLVHGHGRRPRKL